MAKRMTKKMAVDFALSDYLMLRNDGRTPEEAWEGALDNFEDTFAGTPSLKKYWPDVMEAMDRAMKKDAG